MRRNRDTIGEKRPASPVSAAVHAMRIATGEIKEDPEVLARKRARREFPPVKRGDSCQRLRTASPSVPRRLFQGVLDRIGRLSPAPS